MANPSINLIKSGGIETARSLAVDDFIMDGGLGIQDQDLLFNPERAEELQKTVVDSYMSMFDKVARDGYNKKLSKSKATTPHTPKAQGPWESLLG